MLLNKTSGTMEPECPNCASCHVEMTLVNFTVSLLKVIVSYCIVFVPLLKTYKAIESRKVRAAQGSVFARFDRTFERELSRAEPIRRISSQKLRPLALN